MTRGFALFAVLFSVGLAHGETPCSDCWTAKCVEYKGMLPRCLSTPARVAPAAPMAQPRAGSCPTGLVRTSDTQGNCCWPGQAWSSVRLACIGVPTGCPPGMRVAGELCSAAPVARVADLREAEQRVRRTENDSQEAQRHAEVAETEAQEAQRHASLAREADRYADLAEGNAREAKNQALRAQGLVQLANTALDQARRAAGVAESDVTAAACRIAQEAGVAASLAQAHANEARAQSSRAQQVAAEAY